MSGGRRAGANFEQVKSAAHEPQTTSGEAAAREWACDTSAGIDLLLWNRGRC